jgi:CheY-like chemotaxis protein
LVLLDIQLPGKDGYWLAQQMRIAEPGDWTPIIFLSGLDNELDVWRGIEAGGDDYLTKPVKPIVLVAKLRAMRRLLDMRRRLVSLSDELHLANQRLNAMVEVDALTGLINRRGFDQRLHSEILAARRDRQPLTLMLCDLDHFKTSTTAWAMCRAMPACSRWPVCCARCACARATPPHATGARSLPSSCRARPLRRHDLRTGTGANAAQSGHCPPCITRGGLCHALGRHHHLRARRSHQCRKHAHARRPGAVRAKAQGATAFSALKCRWTR